MHKFSFLKRISLLLIVFLITAFSSVQDIQEQKTATDDELLKNVNGDELQKIIESYEGEKAVLVNIWATWCAPCVEEFPEIVELQRNYPDQLKVIFVSADFESARSKALDFLKKQGVDWTTYFKTGKDQEFITTLSDEWTGALPFTKVIGINGETVTSWEQSASYEKFERHVKTAIKLTSP